MRLPNIIIHLSNSTFHEVEERLRIIAKTGICEKSQIEKAQEEDRIKVLLLNYVAPILYFESFTTIPEVNNIFDSAKAD